MTAGPEHGSRWKHSERWIAYGSAAWFGCAIIYSILEGVAWIGGLLAVFAVLGADLLLLASAAVFVLYGLWQGWLHRQVISRALRITAYPIASLAAAVFTYDHVRSTAWMLSQKASLALHRSTFDEIVSGVRRGQLHNVEGRTFGVHGGWQFFMESEPLRIAFRSEAFGDNWSGFVYDPTHAISAADGFTDSHGFSAPPEIHELFGGDIVWCTHLSDDYFVCGFT